MKATQLEYGKLQTSIFKLGSELGEGGAAVMERIDTDEPFRKKVASYMLAGAPDSTRTGNALTQRIARAIMGDMMIGPDQVQRDLGIAIDPKDLETADRVPYLPETLARCSKTHLLVYGYRTHMKEVLEKTNQFGFRWSLDKKSDQESVMLSSSPSVGWYLICRGTSNELKETERLATVVEAFYALSLHKKINKRHYFLTHEYGICNLTSAGGEVYFGLGSSFAGMRYQDGAYQYWIQKIPPAKTERKIAVVLPDYPA